MKHVFVTAIVTQHLPHVRNLWIQLRFLVDTGIKQKARASHADEPSIRDGNFQIQKKLTPKKCRFSEPDCQSAAMPLDKLRTLIDLWQNPDSHLQEWIHHYGAWIYLILFLIILCETGLPPMLFLPGDSLLFATGLCAALGLLNLSFLITSLTLAAIFGGMLNYAVGKWIGPIAFHFEKSRLFNPIHLKEAHDFYERHGGKMLVLGRFIPVIRSFSSFVAGIGRMEYHHFTFFNITGAILWIASMTGCGYLVGRFLD